MTTQQHSGPAADPALLRARALAGPRGQVFWRRRPDDPTGWVVSVRGDRPVFLSQMTAAQAAAEGYPEVAPAPNAKGRPG